MHEVKRYDTSIRVCHTIGGKIRQVGGQCVYVIAILSCWSIKCKTVLIYNSKLGVESLLLKELIWFDIKGSNHIFLIFLLIIHIQVLRCYENNLQEKVVSLLFQNLRSKKWVKKWVKGKLRIKKKSLSHCDLGT